MITPNGGVFGRNPKFNTVTTSGTMTVGTTATVAGNVTLTNGNFIVGTAGKGIDFAITSDGSGTMTSELLSDYEEGTFTPTVSNGVTTPAYTTQNGRYTKIGRVVYFAIWMDLSSGTANGNALTFAGLPFASNSVTYTGGAAVTYSSGWVASTAPAPIPLIGLNATNMVFYNTAGSGFLGTDAVSVLGAIVVAGFYTT